MDATDILHARLRSQLIEPAETLSPEAVVARLGAVQAQDYAGALWAIGLRSRPGTTLADVERAIAERRIVRTWPMRGTLHFVAAADVRWLLALLGERGAAKFATRRESLGLAEADLERAQALFEDALSGGRELTRPEAMALLERGGISPSGQRGYHVLVTLSQRGVLCLGPMRDRQQTFVLLGEWLGADDASSPMSRDEALARLAGRFLAGHGPATVADLARWAGILKSEASAAIANIAASLEADEFGGDRYWFPRGAAPGAGAATSVHLLAGFDEYMLGYTGRSLQLGEHLEAYGSKVAANGMLAPTVVVDGRAVGVWKRTLKTRSVEFAVTEFEPFSAETREALAAEQERYARFVGR